MRMDENPHIDPLEFQKLLEELTRTLRLIFRPFNLAAHLLFETDPRRRHSLDRRIKALKKKSNEER